MDQALNITAVVRTKEHADSMRMVLENFYTDIDMQVGDLSQVAPSLRKSQADILILEISLDSSNDIELLSQIIGMRGSQSAVIATAANADLAGIRSLMRIGVADFLPQPISNADLLAAIDSAAGYTKRGVRRNSSNGHIVSFLRSCGGAGSTTLAVQTALELKGRGKETSDVALVDLDLQFGTIGLSLDVADKGGLPLILETPSRLDKSLLRASMVDHDSGVSILTAPESIVPLTALTPDTVTRMLTLARSEFDFVICDMPHAWTNWTASALRVSDRIVLVTELSVPALQRTRRQLDLISEQGLSEIPLTVIANKADMGWGFSKRQAQAQEALGRKFDFIIRSDPKTAQEARDRGIPMHRVKRRSVIVKDVRAMVEGIKKALVSTEENVAAQPA
jgi:pilus assembly protein CpaE